MKCIRQNEAGSLSLGSAPALLMVIVFIASLILVMAPTGDADAGSSRAAGYEVDISIDAGEPASKKVDPGDMVSFSLVVTNTGTFKDTYNLTWAALPSGWDLGMDGPQGPLADGSYLISDLAPDIPTGITVGVTSPAGKNKPGAASINITVASQTDAATDSLDLSVERPYNAKFTFDIILDIGNPTADELELLPGEDTVGYIDLFNKGNVDDLYSLELRVSQPARADAGVRAESGEWSATFPEGAATTEVELAAKDSGVDTARVSFILQAPTEVVEGEEEVAVTVRVTSLGAGAAPAEGTFTATVLNVPSYILLETGMDDHVIAPGEQHVMEITATNIGHQTVTYTPPESHELTAALGGGDGGSGWTASLGYGPGADIGTGQAELDVGAFAVYVLTVAAPADAAADELRRLEFAGSAGAGGGVIPLDLEFSVGMVHNITFTPAGSSLSLRPGESAEVEILVTNNGNGNDTATLVIGEAPAGLSASASDSLITLVAGDTQMVALTVSVDESTSLDVYAFSVCVSQLANGATEVCGYFELRVDVDDQPDPALAQDGTAVSVPGRRLDTGEQIRINATVKNLGRMDAKNVSVTFSYETWMGSVVDIEEVVIALLEGGGEYTASVLWTTDPAAHKVMVTIDAGDEMAELDETNNAAVGDVWIDASSAEVERGDRTSSDGTSFWTSGDRGAVAVIIFLAAVIIAFIMNAMASEVGRYGLFAAFAPMYSKLRSDRILDNDIRSQVFDYVKANPGDHFRSIMSSLSLTNGTLAYHLATLEREEMIKSERDGGYKRFYPRGRQFIGEVIEINGLQKQILDVIADNPGLSQKKIAMVIGTSTPTVSYHIKALKAARLIEVRRVGKMTKCFISTPAA